MSAPTITIHTDQGDLAVPTGTTVAELLTLLPGVRVEGVATAVNGDFVARHQRAHHVLHEGDTLLCFAPITGG
jgi:thiamine biosynthesis protein ThiS